MDEIVLRTAKAMVSEGIPFRGVLFAGLMIKDGKVSMRAVTLSASFWQRRTHARM
jgi:phosphoribosylamine-glycine ligase